MHFPGLMTYSSFLNGSEFDLLSISVFADNMERESPRIVTLMLIACVWFVSVPFICISQANLEQLGKSVSREIANNENPGMYNYFIILELPIKLSK
jgi:hypothetical protein